MTCRCRSARLPGCVVRAAEDLLIALEHLRRETEFGEIHLHALLVEQPQLPSRRKPSAACSSLRSILRPRSFTEKRPSWGTRRSAMSRSAMIFRRETIPARSLGGTLIASLKTPSTLKRTQLPGARLDVDVGCPLGNRPLQQRGRSLMIGASSGGPRPRALSPARPRWARRRPSKISATSCLIVNTLFRTRSISSWRATTGVMDNPRASPGPRACRSWTGCSSPRPGVPPRPSTARPRACAGYAGPAWPPPAGRRYSR